MTESSPPSTTILVDQEHSAIRFAIPLVLLVGFCLGFFLLDALLGMVMPGLDARVFLACLGAIPLGLLFAALVEALFRRAWPSGRVVKLSGSGIEAAGQSPEVTHIAREKPIHLLSWQFPLADYPRGGRERRVNSSWYCMAVQIQQDESKLILYCFESPKEREKLLASWQFHPLDPKEVYDRSLVSRVSLPTRPEIPPAIIAGKDGRHWLAERERWRSGFELTPPDFRSLLETLDSYEII